MTTPVEELREALEASKALPVMFVGSGISRRYIDSPDWDGLLERFAGLTGKAIAYYRGLAGSDRPQIASHIAREFYDIWFNSPEYKDSRTVFESEVEFVRDPLKYEIARYISGLDRTSETASLSELEALAKVHVHSVVTTNWDTILEDALPDLEVFVGQQDVLFATTQAIGEIYKIHGSVTDPRSLTVTSEDYEEYWDRNPYLIAKLLTMLVEHPVLFLGYGLGDTHINRMLSNLIACLTVEQIEVLNDRLVFVRRARNAESSSLRRGSITVGVHTLSTREYVCDDFAALYEMLSKLPQRFPVKLLRQLRESIYELTFSTEPSGRVHVLPLEEGDDLNNIEVVVGVGTMERLGEKGYSALGRSDICRDMLNGKTDHNPERLLDDLLPRLLRGAKYVPIYYPLFLAGRVDENGDVPDLSGLPANGRALISGTTKLRPYAIRDLAQRQKQTFRELMKEEARTALDYGLVCRYELDDVFALRDFLLKTIGQLQAVGTMEAKLCCKYDRLVYGPDYKGDRAVLHQALRPKRRRGRRKA